MKNRYNIKLARAGKSIGGAAQFVRKQILAGKGPNEVKAMVLNRWPKFSHDKAGLQSRIKMAKKLAHAASSN